MLEYEISGVRPPAFQALAGAFTPTRRTVASVVLGFVLNQKKKKKGVQKLRARRRRFNEFIYVYIIFFFFNLRKRNRVQIYQILVNFFKLVLELIIGKCK